MRDERWRKERLKVRERDRKEIERQRERERDWAFYLRLIDDWCRLDKVDNHLNEASGWGGGGVWREGGSCRGA